MTAFRTGRPIVIAEYDSSWPEKFEAERDRMYAVCGRDAFVRIEHVGSTAVEGLAAKPIIDMMPGVRSLDDTPPIIEALVHELGYEYVRQFELPNDADEGMPFRRYLRKDGPDGHRTFHVHMVEHGSDFWREHLMFRNHLRVFPKDRDAYAALKKEIAARYNANLTAASEVNRDYTDYKTELIEEIKAKARANIERNAPIAIADYDPRWAAIFERERALAARILGDVGVAIEHVGSTSVPRLSAKPMIDLAAGVSSLAEARARVERDGTFTLIFEPDDTITDWVATQRIDEDGVEIHLHLVPHHGERWRLYLRFRDYLRAHPAEMAAYSALKRELAAEFGNDMLGYTEAKTEFVRGITQKAGM